MAYTNKQKVYHRLWYEKNAERLKEKSKNHYLENKEYYQIHNKRNRLEWASRPDVKQKLKEQRQRRYEKHKQIMGDIQLHYGCQNPNCQWQEFHACDLDFHHYDPNQKQMVVGQMASCSIATIITEINKCVILCAICHRRFHCSLLHLTESMMCRVELKDGVVLYLE